MKQNGINMKAGLVIVMAGVLSLLGSGTAWGAAGTRPRVVFDRPGGFTVRQGEEARLSATLAGGSGGIWFLKDCWESNNGGHVTGSDNETFVIDTSIPGLYWVKATGASDGTDGEYTGKIRFRVAPAEGPAAKGAKSIQIGETLVWGEDFSELTMTGGTSVGKEFHGWTGFSWFHVDHALRIGSGGTNGYAISTNATLGQTTGRLEFWMWYHDNKAAVALERSVDGGTSWLPLATYSGLDSSAKYYTVDVPASETVEFKWSNTNKNLRFYLDDVKLYVPWMVEENQPPTIDLTPEGTEATLIAGKPFELELTATDYDGDTITLTATGVPETASWMADDQGTGSVAGDFWWTPETTGTCTVAFSAEDKDGTSTVEVTLTVVPEGPGVLDFESEGARVRESSREVTLTVLRTGGAAGAVSVSWETANGTASNNADYVASSGTLGFAPGQAEATLSVPLLDDIISEDNDKTFTVTLSSPLGGAALGTVETCTVTIVDDDKNANYYSRCYTDGGTLLTDTDLRAKLCMILNENVKVNKYDAGLNPILAKLDECPTNSSLVQCIYLQRGIGSFNKEHIWPQSRGCQNDPAQGDLHHLRACDSTMNSTRNNKNYEYRRNVAGAMEMNGCWYTTTPEDAWEPPDSAKGDVARAVLYMDVRYENTYNTKVDLVAVDGLNPVGTQLGNRATLIAWNEIDPPDDFERRRNELIYSTYQFNRNPFIDHPTWVRAVFDPTNFTNETIEWTVNVTWQGPGRVNSNAAPYGQVVANGQLQEFLVEPDAGRHCHIQSIVWDGVAQAFTTNSAGAATFVSPPVTHNATLAVEFEAERAAMGTPLWWLEQYGAGKASVQGGNWDAAEQEDWNGDGILNWEEYANGTDPAAAVLRPVTGLRAAATDSTGFTLAWEPQDGYAGYRVVVCSTAATVAASAGFESGEADPGWVLSPSGAEVRTNSVVSGTHDLTFSAQGAWLVSPPVENPSALEFQYKRSSSTNQWTLAIDVTTDGGATWTLDVDSVSDAKANAQFHSTDLSAWRDRTVLVRLRDARESGVHQRHLDDLVVKTTGPAVLRGTASGNSWTTAGLAPGTEYDVAVRGETALGEAGPWCSAVRLSTDADESGRRSQTITFPPIADQLAPYPLTLDATASSGLQVVYELDGDGPGVLQGNMVSFTGEGTVTVIAGQPGNTTYAPAQSVTVSFEVSKAPQEITLTPNPIADQPVRATVELSATASSGLPVVCSVAGAVLEGNTLTCTVPGTVTVTASQAGNALWEAVETTTSFTVNDTADAEFVKITTLAALEPGEYIITGKNSSGKEYAMLNKIGKTSSLTFITYLTNAVTPVNNKILSSDSSIVWTLAEDGVNGWTIFNEAMGYVEYHGTGNNAFSTNAITRNSRWTFAVSGGLFDVRNVAATNRTFRFNATSGSEKFACYALNTSSKTLGLYKKKVNSAQTVQTIAFASIGDQTPGATVTLQATASSGLGLTFLLSGDDIAQLSGTTLTLTGTGTVTVTAVQEGNATYRPASASQTFQVRNDQTITFDPIGDQLTTNTVALRATADSGLPVTFSIGGGNEIAHLDGTTLTFTGPGWVTVTASQSGNAAYRPASVSQTFTVSGPEAPKDPYETWLAGMGLSVAGYPTNSTGANGCENWKNFVWDISPTNENTLDVTHMEPGANGALVLTVPLASPNRHFWWVYWDEFRNSTPVEDAEAHGQVLDLGPGNTTMTIPGILSTGGFGILKTTLP